MLNGWLKMTRALGVLAVAFGVLGFVGSYALVPTLLPEYQSGLLLCGLLIVGGIALLTSSRVANQGSPASLINVAACSTLVVALFAATSPEVAPRLWFQAVIFMFGA